MKSLFQLIFQLILLVLPISFDQAFAQQKSNQHNAEESADLDGGVYQRYEITDVNGTSFVQIPATHTKVSVIDRDSTYTKKVDQYGKFSFKGFKPGEVTVTVSDSSGRYAPLSVDVPLVSGMNLIMLEVKLKNPPKTRTSQVANILPGGVVIFEEEKIDTLDESTIVAEAPLISFKGDTLVYNTSLIQTTSSQYVKDLLEQLPGVEMSDAGISVLGEYVSRTYVNGALIFGYNPLDAAKYLAAKQVTSIESYVEDDPDDMTGHSRRRRSRVLNIKTREPLFSVADITLQAGAGFSDAKDKDGQHKGLYYTTFDGRYFSEMRRVSTRLSLDNLGMLGSSSIPSWIRSSGDYASVYLNYEKHWKSALQGDGVVFSYRYDHVLSDNDNLTQSRQFQVGPVPEQYSEESRILTNRSNRHTFSNQVVLRSSERLNFRLDSEVSISDGTDMNRRRGFTEVQGGNRMDKDWMSRSETSQWSVNENLTGGIMHGAFRPSFGANLSVGDTDYQTWEVDTLSSSYFRRNLSKQTGDKPLKVGGYIGHLLLSSGSNGGRNISVDARYTFGFDRRRTIQTAFDLLDTDTPIVNANNTFEYTTNVQSHKGTLSVRGELLKNLYFMSDFSIAVDRVMDVGSRSDGSADKTYLSFIPSIELLPNRQLVGDRNNVVLRYSSSAVLPSVEQLRGRINDTDPLALVAGNPDIRRSMRHSVVGIFSHTGLGKRRNASLSSNVNLGLVSSPIAYRMTYFVRETLLPDHMGYVAPAGASLRESVNTGASYDANMSMTYSDRWSFLKGKLRPTVSLTPQARYNERVQFFGSESDRTSEFSHGLRSTFVIPFSSSVSLNFTGTSSYIHSWTSTKDMQRMIQTDVTAGLSARFLKYGSAKVDYILGDYNSIRNGLEDRTVQRLAFSLGAELLDGRVSVKVSGHDLLNGGTGYSVSTTPSGISQTWTNTFGRFYMMSISYRFNTSQRAVFMGL